MVGSFFKKGFRLEKKMEFIERFWEEILSRDSQRIKLAFDDLTRGEQEQVALHLQTMSTESGWHAGQRISAEAALEVISKIIE